MKKKITTVLALTLLLAAAALAAAEKETLDFIDNLSPSDETPLTQG